MEAVEPIQFSVEGRGFDIDDNYTRRLTGFSVDWDETHDFLLHNVLSDYFDELSARTLTEKYEEVVMEELNPIQEISPALVEQLSPDQSHNHSSRRPSSVLYVGGDAIVVPNKAVEGVFYILSNNKNVARNFRDEIVEDFQSAVDDYMGLGVKEIEVNSGEEFTQSTLLSKGNVTEVRRGEPDSFEEEIYDQLKPISEGFIHNATVNFGEYEACPECDIMLSLTPTSTLYVEVKDYSGTDENPSTNEIIDRPLKKAELLDVGLTVSVVKGLDDTELADFKRSAELRESIEIIEKEDLLQVITQYLDKTIPQDSMNNYGWLM